MLEQLLTLPEVTTKAATHRRTVSNPENLIATLNEEQRAAFDGVIADLLGDTEMILIEGFAGTGKSYLIGVLIEQILFSTKKNIAMTAPTNKAVKVLMDSAKYDHPNLEFSTVHSLLGLREQIDGFGRQKFVQYSRDVCSLNTKNILVVDESSMLSDELFELIHPYVTAGDLKVIFMGDPCQIPPVGMADSIPFNKAKQAEYGIKVYTLNTIVRQAVGNPIIEATMTVRNAIGRDISFPVKEDKYDPETLDGIYWLGADKKQDALKLLKKYFASENFKKDADFVKVICWTNKAVDGFNKLIRSMLYGKEVGRLVIGEKLIAQKPIIDKLGDNDKVIIFNNSDEFEVTNFTVKSAPYKDVPLSFYEVKVQHRLLGGVTTEKSIKIIHESSEDDYTLILEHLKDLATSEKKGTYEAANKWKDYYAFMEIFADVNYNYAVTSHKAQGSTYDNCFVLEEDINANRKVVERNRIKYTALSRPRHKLFVIC